MVKVSLVATSEVSPLSLQCAKAPLYYCGGVAHQYLPQCDSSLGMMYGGIFLHCVQRIFSSSGGVLFLSFGHGLGAFLEFQWSLLLGCDGGSAEGSSLLLALVIPHNVYHGCSSQIVRAPLKVTQDAPLYLLQRGFSLCVMFWWTPLCLWRGKPR